MRRSLAQKGGFSESCKKRMAVLQAGCGGPVTRWDGFQTKRVPQASEEVHRGGLSCLSGVLLFMIVP